MGVALPEMLVGVAAIDGVVVGGLPAEVPLVTLKIAPGPEEVVATVQVLNILKRAMLKL